MKRLTKILSVTITAVMIIAAMPFTAMADGSYYVDNTYMVLKPGQTGTITIGADNAAGRVDWTSSGAVSASGSAFLDNGIATIEVTGNQAGTGFITVTPTDLATYDGEVLSTPYTIQIDVVGEEGGFADGNNNQAVAPVEEQPQQPTPEQPAPEQPAPEQPAPEQPADEQPADEASGEEQPQEEVPAEEQAPASVEVLTDGNSDYADLEEEDRLHTTIDGIERYIIRFPIWLDEEGNNVWNDEVMNLDRLNGFELSTVNYKGVNVDCFQYKDLLQVFVLKNLETDDCQYCVLENGVGFKPLSYISVNGKQYIVVDFPENFQIPEGYQMVEMTLGSNTVHALKKISEQAAPAAEEQAAPVAEEPQEAPAGEGNDEAYAGGYKVVVDKRTRVMLKGYEEVVNPGLDSTDPSNDLYYIFCLVDGKTQLYSYDSGEGTLQRASLVVYNEVPTEPQTVIVYETVTAEQPEQQPVSVADNEQQNLKGIGWADMQIQVKVLLIALAVAIILIIILIILFAAMSRKNKKKNSSKNRKNSRNIPPRARENGGDDDGFFSYVKTEADDFDLEELK